MARRKERRAQMTTTFFSGPTVEATAEFVEWLREQLKAPQNAERHAAALLGDHDWGNSLTVEVRGFYTRTGNPITYSFSEAEMRVETIDE